MSNERNDAETTGLGSTLLPISRIKTIMKSSPEVSAISNESLFLIVKATELFVQDIARQTLKESGSKRSVDYNCLAEIVDKQETLQFLQDIIPKKIRYRDYLAMVESGEIDLNPDK